MVTVAIKHSEVITLSHLVAMITGYDADIWRAGNYCGRQQ